MRHRPDEIIQRETADIAFLLGAALTMPVRDQRDRCIDMAISCLDRALTARLEDRGEDANS